MAYITVLRLFLKKFEGRETAPEDPAGFGLPQALEERRVIGAEIDAMREVALPVQRVERWTGTIQAAPDASPQDQVGAGGAVTLYNGQSAGGSAHLIADVAGYFRT